jgi:hypothetical protein
MEKDYDIVVIGTGTAGRTFVIRIGMLSPIAVSTLNKEYDALESLVALLTKGLIKRGIDVTLFATPVLTLQLNFMQNALDPMRKIILYWKRYANACTYLKFSREQMSSI